VNAKLIVLGMIFLKEKVTDKYVLHGFDDRQQPYSGKHHKYIWFYTKDDVHGQYLGTYLYDETSKMFHEVE
jgi:hypothetical protein